MTTAPNGELRRQDFHLQVQQLVSLRSLPWAYDYQTRVNANPQDQAHTIILDQLTAEVAHRRHQGQAGMDGPPGVVFVCLRPAKVDTHGLTPVALGT
jgi:hypothetical protein